MTLAAVATVIACLLSGALIGFLGGMLGIGGGLIAIPALSLILGMEQQMAQGTALVMILPAVTMAVRKYNQRARIDFAVAACGAVSAMICTWAGAYMALGIEPASLRRAFSVFLFGIGVFYVWQTWSKGRPSAAERGPAPPEGRINRWQGAMLGVVSGTMGGFFGVGGAVLSVPIMTACFRLSQTSAQALALTMIIPGSFVALATYAWGGQTDWLVGLPLAAGCTAFIPMGVKLAYRLPERALRGAFAVLLFLTIPLMFVGAGAR